LFLHLYHHHLVAVSEFVNGGELLGLCQSYGLLPEELVRIYVAEISLAIGKLFLLVDARRIDLFSYMKTSSYLPIFWVERR